MISALGSKGLGAAEPLLIIRRSESSPGENNHIDHVKDTFELSVKIWIRFDSSKLQVNMTELWKRIREDQREEMFGAVISHDRTIIQIQGGYLLFCLLRQLIDQLNQLSHR